MQQEIALLAPWLFVFRDLYNTLLRTRHQPFQMFIGIINLQRSRLVK